MEDKTHHCGASETAALPLLEGTTAEKRRGKEKEATSPSIAPERPAEPERGARSGNAALSRPGSAAALAPAPGSSRSPFSDRLSASSSLPPSLPQRLLVAARSPRARRVPDAVPPSAGGSSRCHFTPTSRRRRRQLLLLNSRRSGGMKSSSPPPPRAAALRSRRGGGDGPVARRPEPRGALALHPPRRGRRSRGSTRARLPRNLRGAQGRVVSGQEKLCWMSSQEKQTQESPRCCTCSVDPVVKWCLSKVLEWTRAGNVDDLHCGSENVNPTVLFAPAGSAFITSACSSENTMRSSSKEKEERGCGVFSGVTKTCLDAILLRVTVL
ncbi:uncharacterized protein GJ701_000002 [Geothlypis trichas]